MLPLQTAVAAGALVAINPAKAIDEMKSRYLVIIPASLGGFGLSFGPA